MKAASPAAGAGGWQRSCGLGEDAPRIDAGSPSSQSPERWGAGQEVPVGAVCWEQPGSGKSHLAPLPSYMAFGKSLPFSLHEFCLL